MISIQNLENILTKYRIIKEFAPLPELVLGYYEFDGDYYVILINESIRSNERLYRIVLAEEIGHYRTTIGDITPRRYMCNQARIELDKKELLALRWATDFLIPTDQLIKTIKSKVANTVTELVDHFYVTEDFLMQKFKFKFMSRQKSVWDINETKVLCLYNLPSIYILEKF